MRCLIALAATVALSIAAGCAQRAATPTAPPLPPVALPTSPVSSAPLFGSTVVTPPGVLPPIGGIETPPAARDLPRRPQADPEIGIGGRSPLSDTSPSARPAGIGGHPLGDTSPSSRAVGLGGRALGDTSPSDSPTPLPPSVAPTGPHAPPP